MVIYEVNSLDAFNRPAYLIEQHMYGSSRLGFIKRSLNVDSLKISPVNANLIGATYLTNFTRGNELFELTNHLGNVLVTVSDKKYGKDIDANGQYDFYTADSISSVDYTPFGMEMVNRYSSAGSFRYGFNGKENDNEVKGVGNQQDYGARVYDPRLGKFLSIDPLTAQYPWYTPYQFAGNKPIVAIDLDGLEELLSKAKLRVEAAKLGVVGNKRIGELFERVAVAALSGRSVSTFSNSSINYYSAQRELRNGPNGPTQVRPDLVGFSFDIEKTPAGTDIRYGANQFFEVKATGALITRAYRKGQIEGMIDVLSEQAKKNKDQAAELVIIGISDLRINSDIFEYAKQKGVTLSAIVAGIDDQGQIYFSDVRTLQSGQKGEKAGVIDLVKDIFNTLFGGGTFEGKPGWDLKDFTNGISNKGADPTKIDVPNPRSEVNDPDPPEIDDK